MLNVGLSMLSLRMSLFLKMVKYVWSYAVWKFDDAYLLCSILGLYVVLMEINSGFLFAIAC